MRTRDVNKVELVKEKAVSLLVELGIEGFTMNKLASACKISVATLYIYYKDKDDLIIQIGTEEVHKLTDIILEDFDPEASFADGLRQQWKNRVKSFKENPLTAQLMEQLRTSSYQEKFYDVFFIRFKETLGRFLQNVIARGEIDAMPVEMYWSLAFGPLYSLLRFHADGRNLAQEPFALTDEMLWKTFDMVLNTFKK